MRINLFEKNESKYLKLSLQRISSEITSALFQAMEDTQVFFFFFLHSTGVQEVYLIIALEELLQNASEGVE